METRDKRIASLPNGATVEYTLVNDCEECCDTEGVCRCGRVENARVSAVDLKMLCRHFHSLFFEHGKTSRRNGMINQILYGSEKELDTHCIDRVLRANRAWLAEAWEVGVIDGYYGQELGEAQIRDRILEKINSEIEEVLGLGRISEKVEFLLRLEYGRVLPELDGKRYEIRKIAAADIIRGSSGHSNLVSAKNCDYYSDLNFSGIRCLVSDLGDGKYRLIDGYHRISATLKETVTAIVAF